MLRIVPAGESFRNAALNLLYAGLSTGERREQLSQLQLAVESGEVALDDLLVALDDEKPVGAILAVRRAGGMAFVWPPATVKRARDTARPLLEGLARQLDAEGLQFAQCLLEPGDEAQLLMNDCGFPYCTDILLLTRPVSLTIDAPILPLSSIVYEEANHPLFTQVMDQTFVGSFDCPALARIRRGEAALAAHRDSDHFDRELWQLFQFQGKVVGLLLCTDHSDRQAREISYLGVVPEARGLGIGRALVIHALHQARRDDCGSLEVAVDAGNRYALEIYRHSGFKAQRRMAVHLRLRNAVGDASN